MADQLKFSHKPTGLAAAIPFAKIASLILIVTATTVILTVRLALPYCLTLLSSASSFRAIWVAAQLIIFIVWKLSVNKKQDETPPNEDNPGGSFVDQIQAPHLSDEVPEIRDSYLDQIQAPHLSDAVPEIQAQDSSKPVPEIITVCPVKAEPANNKKPVVSVGITETTSHASSTEEAEDHDSMEATWQAIMDGGASPVRKFLRKSDTWEGPPSVEALARQQPVAGRPEMRKSKTFREAKAAAPGWRGREALVVGGDELSGRVEAFIKMHYDHLKLQRQESEQRRFTGFVNHAY